MSYTLPLDNGLLTLPRQDEIDRGITIKSTAISMYFPLDKEYLADIKQKVDGAWLEPRLNAAEPGRKRILGQPYRLSRSRRLLV